MISLSVSQLFQLYAPLAGLLALAFWTGSLSNRVRTLEKEAELTGEAEKADAKPGGKVERMVRLETKLSSVETRLSSIDRHMEGVQRQLGNLMRTRGDRGENMVELRTDMSEGK